MIGITIGILIIGILIGIKGITLGMIICIIGITIDIIITMGVIRT